MLKMGEVMADAVVCGWKDSNYTTKGTPGWAQQNCDNYVCQCGFFLLISFRGSGLRVNNLSLLSGNPGVREEKEKELPAKHRVAYTQGKKPRIMVNAWPQMMQALPDVRHH